MVHEVFGIEISEGFDVLLGDLAEVVIESELVVDFDALRHGVSDGSIEIKDEGGVRHYEGDERK